MQGFVRKESPFRLHSHFLLGLVPIIKASTIMGIHNRNLRYPSTCMTLTYIKIMGIYEYMTMHWHGIRPPVHDPAEWIFPKQTQGWHICEHGTRNIHPQSIIWLKIFSCDVMVAGANLPSARQTCNVPEAQGGFSSARVCNMFSEPIVYSISRPWNTYVRYLPPLVLKTRNNFATSWICFDFL